ncbi:hypothetical protein EVAR_4732_1 [Eumeta japonica]|uniref:Uncharacterized protein n=1 Tax=Eumeta variegata TaxID=151549 RepID=A0A4C1T1C0_EUMVA|nr:hypothetical protein EVAR_4732_1 [Eumeta japonica]
MGVPSFWPREGSKEGEEVVASALLGTPMAVEKHIKNMFPSAVGARRGRAAVGRRVKDKRKVTTTSNRYTLSMEKSDGPSARTSPYD